MGVFTVKEEFEVVRNHADATMVLRSVTENVELKIPLPNGINLIIERVDGDWGIRYCSQDSNVVIEDKVVNLDSATKELFKNRKHYNTMWRMKYEAIRKKLR